VSRPQARAPAEFDLVPVRSPRDCVGRQAPRWLLELMNAGRFQLVSGGRGEDRYRRKRRVIERDGPWAIRWSLRGWRGPGTAPGAAGADNAKCPADTYAIVSLVGGYAKARNQW
jgi:hypothetical protein